MRNEKLLNKLLTWSVNLNRRKPTIYVAGPMRGYEDYNYPAFDRCAKVLRAQGWRVINPADLDRNAGKPMSDPMSFSPDTNYEDHEYMRDALKRDMDAICDECTAIYMMSDWEKSKGAKTEWALAKALGLDIYYEAPLPE
tara:strand:- start:53 stop:472 length:420 start_codon:yes stop_codon:yes gene_type:complete